jgi:hypothetical protein
MSEERVWDEEFAQKLIGKILLVGLTWIDPAGDRVEQMHGEVVSVDARRGIELRLAGERAGDVFWLPPDLRGVAAAAPAAYRLRATGEVVENPDFTATLVIHPPKGSAP